MKTLIEVKNEVVTDDFFKGVLNEKRIKAYKDIARDYNISESTVRDIFSLGISFTVANLKAAETNGL